MRQLYDHYGVHEVLSHPFYLTHGLDDLLVDAFTLRSLLSKALDAGVGAEYLTQISSQGVKDAAFDGRVHTLLTDEAGLSEGEATEVQGLLDEMVGWPAVKHKKKTEGSHTQTQKQAKAHESAVKTAPVEAKSPVAAPQPLPLPSEAVPQLGVYLKRCFMLSFGAVFLGVALILASLVSIGAFIAFGGVFLLLLFFLLLIPAGRFVHHVEGSERYGSTLTLRWVPTKAGAQSTWYFAVDGQWREAYPPERFTLGKDNHMHGSVTLQNVPSGARLSTCARRRPGAKLFCVSDWWSRF